MSEPITPEEVEQQVQEVNTWYAEQIIAERRAGADPERLKVLKEGLAACAADHQALQDADDEEVAQIAARYAALLKKLGE